MNIPAKLQSDVSVFTIGCQPNFANLNQKAGNLNIILSRSVIFNYWSIWRQDATRLDADKVGRK